MFTKTMYQRYYQLYGTEGANSMALSAGVCLALVELWAKCPY